jgi:hypothetical protein
MSEHQQALEPAMSEQIRSSLYKSLAIGLALLSVGAVMTFATYVNAEGGGTYYILWGPMVFGLWRTAKAGWGLWELNQGRTPDGFAPVALHEWDGGPPSGPPQLRWPQPPAGHQPPTWPQPPAATSPPPRRRKGSVI